MGSKQHPANSFAQIKLDLEKHVYVPGEELCGRVKLTIKKSFKASTLIVNCIGKEEVAWDQYTGQSPITHKASYQIFQKEAVLRDFQNEIVESGEQDIQFDLVLPEMLQSTFLSKEPTHKCHLSYTVTVSLKGQKTKLYVSRPFIVTRQLIPDPVEELKTDERQIRGCFCLKKGKSVLNCQFHKGEYHVDQKAKVDVQIDNLHCKLAVKKIKLEVYQKLKLFLDKNKEIEKVIDCYFGETSIEGVKQNSTIPYKVIEFDLNKLVATLNRNSDYRKINKKVYGNYFLQPSVHGSLIECQYILKVSTLFKGPCHACSNHTKVSMLVEVGPSIEFKPSFEIQEGEEIDELALDQLQVDVSPFGEPGDPMPVVGDAPLKTENLEKTTMRLKGQI